MGWVEFSCSAVRPVLLGADRNWAEAAVQDGGTPRITVIPTQVSEQMNHSVVSLRSDSTLGMGRIVDFEKTEFPNICFLALNGRFS